MTRERFTQLVEDALREIPKRFRREMRNVAVVVEDEPSRELLAELEMEPGDSLFGLYQGTPLPERSWSFGNNLPDRISIYQRPTEEACETEDDKIGRASCREREKRTGEGEAERENKIENT